MIGRRLKGLLCLEAALCLILGLALRPAGGVTAVLAFPFAPMGRALRALSLSGGAGNVCALVLYTLFCLLPAGALTVLALRRKGRSEDALLLIMSALLFFQMYWMVNPSLMPEALGPAAAEPMGGALLGGMFYSLLAAWLLLRFLRFCAAADGERLSRCCAAVLFLLGAALIFSAFALGPVRLSESLRALEEANTGAVDLGPSRAVLIIGCLAGGAVCLLDLWVLFSADRLLGLWAREPYGPETVLAAERLSRRSVRALYAGLLLGQGVQLVQLLLLPRLHTVSFHLELPLLSVVLVLAALLLARFFREGKRLKDDNDLFI